MNTGALRNIYMPHNVEIARIFGLLDDCEPDIARHESKLTTLRAQKSSLEKMIAKYHNERVPVNRLSEEVLHLIFMELAQEELMAIDPILFVCKRWKDIAINSAALWRRIKLSLAGSEAGIERQTQHIKRALRYSKSASLDITIQTPGVRDLWEAFKRTTVIHPKHKLHTRDAHYYMTDPVAYRSQIGKDVDYPGLGQWYDGSFRETDAEQFRHTSVVLFGRIDNAIYKLMEALVGSDGDTLLRARSLTIIYHGTIFSTWFDASLLHRPVPHLEELVLIHYGDGRSPGLLPSAAPKLLRIACDRGLSTSKSLFQSGQLEVLHYHLSTYTFEKTLDGFPERQINLKTLYLCFEGFEHLHSDPLTELSPQRRKDFRFPRLDRLIISGSWPSNLIAAPKLRTLTLLDNKSLRSFLGHISLPRSSSRLSPLRLHIAPLSDGMGGFDYSVLFNDSARKLLSLSSITEIAFVGPDESEVISSMLKLEKLDPQVSIKGYLVDSERLFRDFRYQYEMDEVFMDE